jgi:lysophospholipase L1-like esterase
VIGDSMVKNIDACKIGRASRSKAISHSYSGATVNQLTEKFGNHQSEKEFSTVIIHVGTNDLVRDEPKKVAANLENLINKVKVHTEKIAVSGTIKRLSNIII